MSNLGDQQTARQDSKVAVREDIGELPKIRGTAKLPSPISFDRRTLLKGLGVAGAVVAVSPTSLAQQAGEKGVSIEELEAGLNLSGGFMERVGRFRTQMNGMHLAGHKALGRYAQELDVFMGAVIKGGANQDELAYAHLLAGVACTDALMSCNFSQTGTPNMRERARGHIASATKLFKEIDGHPMTSELEAVKGVVTLMHADPRTFQGKLNASLRYFKGALPITEQDGEKVIDEANYGPGAKASWNFLRMIQAKQTQGGVGAIDVTSALVKTANELIDGMMPGIDREPSSRSDHAKVQYLMGFAGHRQIRR